MGTNFVGENFASTAQVGAKVWRGPASPRATPWQAGMCRRHESEDRIQKTGDRTRYVARSAMTEDRRQ